MAKQQFIGTVIGTAMQKTAKVLVERQRLHPLVGKTVNYRKTFLAHDEHEKCVLGDLVKIEACRPLSKRKSFMVSEIVKPSDETQ